MMLAQAAQVCTESLVQDVGMVSVLEKAAFSPFHVVSLMIFALAICHTFFANKFTQVARRLEVLHEKKRRSKRPVIDSEMFNGDSVRDKSFMAEIFYFLGEVEVIFGIWVIPLFIAISGFYDWKTAVAYIDNRSYTEPIFVVVVMCLTATRPLVKVAESAMQRVAKILGGSVSAWWFSILTIGPILGSFITEAGAMTLAALLLGRQFYQYKPSPKLAYATIGLLFVNISVGGVLTNFAAPPVLIVAKCWGWSSWHMFTFFGWKALSGILISNTAIWFLFKKQLKRLQSTKNSMKGHTPVDEDKEPIPIWITLVHVFLLFWIVLNSHYPPVFIGSFLLFLGFHHATAPHQFALSLKRPILVGFFLAGLVIHGGLQAWWIEPALGGLQEGALMLTGVILTAFNDNAAVVYLASLLPTLGESLKYAIMSGVIIGGGLTVIANAPNPAGQMILRKYFRGGVSPLFLFLAALGPTLVFLAIFFFTMAL